MINEAIKSKFTRVNFFIHNLAQMRSSIAPKVCLILTVLLLSVDIVLLSFCLSFLLSHGKGLLSFAADAASIRADGKVHSLSC